VNKKYELIFIISETIADPDIQATIEAVKKIITDAQGTILHEENLDRKKLAYQIKKNTYGTYVVFNLELPKEAPKIITEKLKMIPEILRHLIVIQDKLPEIKPRSEIAPRELPQEERIEITETERLEQLEKKLGEILAE